MALSLETQTCRPGVTVLVISGRLSLGQERGQIESAVLKVLNEGVRKLVFDLSQVDYIDSTGIGVIAYCFGRISQRHGHAGIAGANDLTRELFRLTRLDNVIAFYPDVAAAAEGLTSTALA